MTPRISSLYAAGLATAIVAGFASGASAQPRSCVDVLTGMPQFSRVVGAIVQTHVVDDLRSAHDITIFAPTNDAVAKVNPILVDRLFPTEDGARRADPVLAPAAIGAHIVQSLLTGPALTRGGSFRSVAGAPVTVTTSGGTVRVAGVDGTSATVVQANIPCANGVIHAIDAVLLR